MIEKDKSPFRSEWIVLLGLMALVILLRLPSLEEPFDNDSGANAYHARLILRGEPLYGTHHPAHHMPAVYYTYALAFMLFGDSSGSVKLLLIPWSIVSAYLVYRLGIRLGKATAIIAAIFFIVLTSHLGLKGSTAEIELFVNLPRTGAILLCLHLNLKKDRSWKYIFVGLLCGVVFMFKATYLDSFALSLLIITLDSFIHRDRIDVWKEVISRIFWLGVGFLAALLPVILYFQSIGLLDRFFLVFKLGSSHIASLPTSLLSLLLIPGIPFYILIVNNFVLLWLSIVGISEFFRGVRKGRSQDESQWLLFSILIAWYILSWIEAGISRWGFQHYGLLVVPPLSLAAAYGLMWFHQKYIEKKGSNYSLSLRSPSVIILIVVFFISAINNIEFHYHYASYKLGFESYGDFLREGSPEGAVYASMQEMMDYIKSNTSDTDYVYCWCGNVQFYYYIDRRAPIETPWTRYAEAFGSYERIFVPQTKYVIVGENIFVQQPDWLAEQLTKSYELDTVIQDYQIYRRIE